MKLDEIMSPTVGAFALAFHEDLWQEHISRFKDDTRWEHVQPTGKYFSMFDWPVAHMRSMFSMRHIEKRWSVQSLPRQQLLLTVDKAIKELVAPYPFDLAAQSSNAALAKFRHTADVQAHRIVLILLTTSTRYDHPMVFLVYRRKQAGDE